MHCDILNHVYHVGCRLVNLSGRRLMPVESVMELCPSRGKKKNMEEKASIQFQLHASIVSSAHIDQFSSVLCPASCVPWCRAMQ